MSHRQAHTIPGSRRRRLLVIRQSAPQSPLQHREPTTRVDSAAPLAAAEDVGPPLTPAVAISAVGLAASAPQPFGPECAQLQSLLRRPADLTWVIAGNNLEPAHSQPREWRSFSGRLTDHVRLRLGRAHDMFVVSAAAGRRLASVAADLERQVLRFRPEIVLLGIGPEESLAGKPGLTSFESSLISVISAVGQQGATLCLQTPPLTPVRSPAESIDQLIYVEAIRAIAAEYDLPLVDHYAHWESVATEIGGLERWFDGESNAPGRIGHEQLARLITAELALDIVRISD